MADAESERSYTETGGQERRKVQNEAVKAMEKRLGRMSDSKQKGRFRSI